jgi:hypothetical protein
MQVSIECADRGRAIQVLVQLFVPLDSDVDDWPTTARGGSPPERVAPLRLNGGSKKGKPLRLGVASPAGESQETPCHGWSSLYTQASRSVVMHAE